MKCPECGSGDVSFLMIRNGINIYECNSCNEEFVLENDIY